MSLLKPEESPFRVTDEAVRWSGPLDAEEPDTPTARLRYPRDTAAGEALARAVLEGDPHSAERAVRSAPVPAGMLDALALHRLQRRREDSLALASGTGPADPRWSRALALAARGLGVSASSVLEREPEVLFAPSGGRRVRSLRALPGGRLALVAAVDRTYDADFEALLALGSAEEGLRERALPASKGTELSLPLALLPGAEGLWLTAWNGLSKTCELLALGADGAALSSARCSVPSPPQRVSAWGSRLWMHCNEHHVLFDGDAEPALYEHDEGDAYAPAWVGASLLLFSRKRYDKEAREHRSAVWRWLDLARGEAGAEQSWEREQRFAERDEEALYVPTPQGVFRFEGGSAPRRLSERDCFAAARWRDVLLVTDGDGVLELDPRSGEVRARRACAHGVYKLFPYPGGYAAADFQRLTCFDAAGQRVYESAKRREPSRALLADGTALLSAGEEVLALDAQGTPRGMRTLPYDGQLLGATARFALFGPVSGGVESTKPDALYALDARAAAVERVPFDLLGYPVRPERSRYGGGTEQDRGALSPEVVYLVDARGALRAWTPRGDGASSALPPLVESARRATERGARVPGFDTCNPRDDWPVPGVEVAASRFVAFDGLYCGTTGVAADVSARAREGSVVTLVRCVLDRGGHGVEARQRSTVVLFDCALAPSSVRCDEGSFVLSLRAEQGEVEVR